MTLNSFSRSHQHFEIFKFVNRFWWPCPNFQGHHSIKTVKFSNFDPKKKLVCTIMWPYLLNQMTDSSQTSYIVTLGCFKDWFRFRWPWPNFQGHHTIKTVKWAFAALLSPEPINWFWPNLHRNTIGTWGRNDWILMTLASFQRSHQHSENIAIFIILSVLFQLFNV